MNVLESAGLCLLAVAAILALGPARLDAQQETPITRAADGSWERSNQGKRPLKAGSELRILTSGNVVVRGSDAEQLQFRFHQKVRAGNHDQAALLMGPLVISAQSSGNRTLLTVLSGSAINVQTDLEIDVPRKLSRMLVQDQLGGIAVYDIQGHVDAETLGGAIQMDRISGNVSGRTAFGEIRLGVITGTVHCSTGGGSVTLERSGGEADCATAGGNISVGRVGGPLVISTEGGNIQVDSVNGPVQAHSVSGLIEIEQARGMVYADTRDGSIHVGQSAGVSAQSAGGMIQLKQASGPLTVSTLVGNILAELMGGMGFTNSSMMTRSGDITVTIPGSLGVSVQAVNTSGIAPRIVSDFPEVHMKSIGFRSPVAGQGSINGGGPLLHLDADGGVIYLKRAK